MHDVFFQYKLDTIEVDKKPISRRLEEMGRTAFQGWPLAQVLDMTVERPLAQQRGTRHLTIEKFYYPHKYSIQITTDSPQWDSLSGCTLDEAVSKGKVAANEGSRVTGYYDATIVLPLNTYALIICMERRNSVPDMDWLI